MSTLARFARHRKRHGRALVVAFVIVGSLGISGTAGADDGGSSDRPILGIWEVQSLSGANNNPFHPNWGIANSNYPRVTSPAYADGIGQMVEGPNTRYVSNRTFNDTNQKLYTPRNVSQWGFVWGQFVDHNIALRLGKNDFQTEPAFIPFDNNDPLDAYRDDLGYIFFGRSAVAPNTGKTTPREQINQVTSYLDASAVYGDSDARLDWLREGSVDGNPDNNGAMLLMQGNYLPRRDARGNADAAPMMVVGGALQAVPGRAATTGDIRANENPTLLATQTLFAREHNRIVSQLPSWMTQQDKFQIARAVVIAEQQYITYTEFLPTLGVTLPRYTGYKREVDASISNEFATVGYRAHSQVRTDFTIEAQVGHYSQATLDRLAAMGVHATVAGGKVTLMVPLGEDSFFNPDLLELLQLGPTLQGIGLRPQANNEEQISNLLRSFTFSLDPTCVPSPSAPPCPKGLNDLGAIDVQRGRDHGIPSYNQLRVAYGLLPKTSFKAITGESTEAFPSDPLLTPGNEINDPNSMDFTALYDAEGHLTTPEADNATRGVRRTTLAARLKALYGDVNKVDAFVGMSAEPHLSGGEFGELQLAIWRKQFAALRDGDRFFYANNPLQPFIRHTLGIDYRKSLGDIIALNTDIPRDQLAPNVFVAPEEDGHTVAAAGMPSTDLETALTGSLSRSGSGHAGAFRVPALPDALMPVGSVRGVSAPRTRHRT